MPPRIFKIQWFPLSTLKYKGFLSRNPSGLLKYIQIPSLIVLTPDPFFSTGLAGQTAQKQKSGTNKSLLMQHWVFQLGMLHIKRLSGRAKIFFHINNIQNLA